MEEARYTTSEAAREVIKKLNLQQQERLLIIYDAIATDIAASIMTAAEMINGKNSSAYCLNAHQIRNGKGFKFTNDIRKLLENVDVSFFVTGENREDELKSLREPMIEFLRSRENLRHAHAPGITEADFLKQNGAIDYTKTRI